MDFMANGFAPRLLTITLANGNEHLVYSWDLFMAAFAVDSPVKKIRLISLSTSFENFLPLCIDNLYVSTAIPDADLDSDGIADSSDNCPAIANPTQADCNHDGAGDACEIAAGAPDFNHDSVPDYCQCLADLVLADRNINGADLGALLSQWGVANASTVSDINRDGRVDGADLGYLLSNWGPCTN